MTLDQLNQIMPRANSRASLFLDPLNRAMDEFEINTPARQAAFLAQVGHESGQLYYVREIASGRAYEGRADLGNTQPGDGMRYKGRGLIQVTGRANYIALMMALNIDCVIHPELIEQPVNACRSAGWFWQTNNLNKWADLGDNQAVSGVVNTGSPTRSPDRINGLAERQALYAVAKCVLGVA